MATDEESKTDEAGKSPVQAEPRLPAAEEGADVAFTSSIPAQLGLERYVHVAFFAAGVLVAYLSGQVLASTWNALAAWPAAVRAVPQLLQYAEDERPTFTMAAGAVIGIVAVVFTVRKGEVRRWAEEVAQELYKVHWPERETVTDGTIVVLVASVFATLYVGLLDRVWAFVTNLVYGA
jgi:preprotein translocase subunit SecE